MFAADHSMCSTSKAAYFATVEIPFFDHHQSERNSFGRPVKMYTLTCKGNGPKEYVDNYVPELRSKLDPLLGQKGFLRIPQVVEGDFYYVDCAGDYTYAYGDGHTFELGLTFSSLNPALERKWVEDHHDRVVKGFRALLDARDTSEEQLHQYLVDNAFLLYHLFPVKGCLAHGDIYSKVPLGSEYVTDFVGHWCNTGGDNYVLIEIERASVPIFKKHGDPSSALTHAIRQVQDWHAWATDNHAYAAALFAGLRHLVSLVIIGRRRDLDTKQRRRLEELNESLKGHPTVCTFDSLLDSNKRLGWGLTSGY